MRRVVDVLYGLQGYPNATRFTEFKTDLFANGSTPAINMNTASTTGITISAACTTGLLISGACSADGISITSICADAIHISGANTASGLHISGDQAVAILFDVTAAATDGLKIAVPAGITLTDGIEMSCTGTGTITNAINISYTNSATEVIAVTVATGKTITTGMSFSGAGTYTTGILLDATAIGTGISITGTCATAGIDFGAASVTTGTLIDYIGITGKVSGYLFNGSCTTSTLTGSTLFDDFGCSCNHNGVAADTLRMIRRTWTGNLPNGTLAADFVIAEFSYSGTAGTAAGKAGSVTGLKVDLGSATINDSSLSVYGIYVDPTVTNTASAGLYGLYMPGGATTYIPFQVGAKASTAGSGLKLSGSGDNSSGVQLYFDDGGASVAGEVVTPIRSRMLVTVNQTSGTSVCGSFSQMVTLGTTGATKALTTGALRAAYIFNQVGALTMTSAAEVAGINQAITVAGNTTVDTTSTFVGIDINIRGAGTVTPAGNGVVSALYIRSSETTAWTTAIKIKDAAAPTAIAIGTCTTAIDLTDASGVTNLLKFNEAAGCVISADVDPLEAPSVGGLGASGCLAIDVNGQDFYIPYFATYCT